MPNLILELEVERVDLVDEGANSAAFIRLYKRRETDSNMDLNEILAKMTPEHASIITEELAKAKSEVPAEVQTKFDEDLAKAKAEVPEETQAELAEAVAKAATAFDELETVKKGKQKQEEPDFEEAIKSMDPTMQTFFKSLKLKNDAAEEALRQAEVKRIEDEAVAKARDLKALPVEEAELVEVLKSADDKVLAIFSAANAMIANSPAFEELGKRNGTSTVTGTADAAWDNLAKKAKEIEKRDGITEAKAVAKAMKEFPELYREYLKGGQ